MGVFAAHCRLHDGAWCGERRGPLSGVIACRCMRKSAGPMRTPHLLTPLIGEPGFRARCETLSYPWLRACAGGHFGAERCGCGLRLVRAAAPGVSRFSFGPAADDVEQVLLNQGEDRYCFGVPP